MATADLNLYKKKRGLIRTSVTKLIKKLETSLAETEATDENEIEELLEQLEDKFEALKLADNDLEKLWSEDCLDRELESAEEYRDKIVTWRFRARKRLRIISRNNDNDHSITPNPSSEEYKNVRHREISIKLPKITIPKFYGDVSNWLTFWNSFETAIHNNEHLDNVDRFNYLKAHLAGTALETVEGFSISSENYDKAIKLLQNRFAVKEVLINEHMQNLLHIPPLKRSNDIKCFRKLFDKCQTQIRSLGSLGVSSETFGSLLGPLIMQKLPHDLILEFNKQSESVNYTIDNLINFLHLQLSARERAESSIQSQSPHMAPPQVRGNDPPRQMASAKSYGRERNNFKQNKTPTPTASELFSGVEVKDKQKSCVFCDRFHGSSTCDYARNLTNEDRKAILIKKRACFRCLKMGNHLSRFCKFKVTCSVCGKRHFDIMCFETSAKDNSNVNAEKETEPVVDNTVLSNYSCTNEVYLQTLIVYIIQNDLKYLVRCLVDTGSQKSYCSKFIAKQMKLKGLGEETVNHGLFGGFQHSEKHERYKIKLASVDEKYNCEFEALDQAKICASIPKLNDAQYMSELKSLGIFASDIAINGHSCLFEKNVDEIHLLIGADIAGKLFTGKIEQLSGGLVAVHTHLGWTVMGKSLKKSKIDSSLLVLSLHVNNAKINDLWNLDTLGIKDISENRTKVETQELALKHFEDTVSRDDNGRYKVHLPWLENHPPLTSNRDLAHKRLKNTVKSLESMNKLKDYQEVINEWEKEGIIEEINSDLDETNIEELGVHYLPHRAVFKDNSTTQIRPVFDGSAKSRNSVSLNDCLEKGPNLIEMIPSILNRFRWGKIGVVADIRKAFLQISLHENDRNFLRFLWWKDGDPRKEITYRHCRVVFGVSCSPFLLAAVLNHVMDQVEEPLKDFAKKLKGSMYVDNCVTSVNSTDELEYFRTESQKLLRSARFDLRGWRNNDFAKSEESANNSSCSPENSDVSVLGLTWDTVNDTLSCELIDEGNEDEPITKRRILSIAHRIFDPIGFTSPVTLIPKLLLQECWKMEATWDSKLPEEIVRRFEKWKSQLHELKNIKIPRRLSILELEDSNLTLHVFCDASKSAYATCIFLRAEKEDTVTCQLIQARSRVAPLKGLSIPRLELLACNIGARLADSVKKDLHLRNIETFYWSDSMDVLYWIKKEGPWATFVLNRVQEIRSLSPVSEWKFVPGVQNGADLPSRGCSVKTLIKGHWLGGPLWLKDSRDKWPDFELTPNESVINAEKKKTIVSSINSEKNEYYHRISSYKKIIRVTAWIYRFYENAKRPSNKKLGELSAEELKKAEHIMLKNVQKESFHSEKKENLKSLPTFTDADGLIRVKTKILFRDDDENFRVPVVLPTDHPVVKALILWKHTELGHSGVQALMASLRQDYWVLKSRRIIKKVIRTCVVCQRFSVKPPDIPEGPLPEDRVRNASIFEIIGVDVAGPLILRDNRKTWILILTCAVYRAVHLELLTSLSTDNFLLALRRFIARRGRPTIIYSDHGTNFVGAENFLKKTNLEKLKTSISPIIWKFIPPAAPWWGGFWERLIGLLKRILRKVLGRTSLTYEEMHTVLCDCESQLNARPLTYVTDDPNDLSPITPEMFLKEIRHSGTTDLDYIDSKEKKELNKRLVYRKRVMTDLRVRFRNEYLGQLQQRTKLQKRVYDPKVGDIVLIWTDKVKRISWPLGRILSVFRSKDGLIRRAKIQTKSGVLTRPIRKLCPLELDGEDIATTHNDRHLDDHDIDSTPSTVPDQPSVTTRVGRKVRLPARYKQ